MKKLIISAVALTIISFSGVGASGVQANQFKTESAYNTQKSQEKQAVKIEDLPDGIKSALKSADFTGWNVTDAFLITKPDKSQYYELSVKKGQESARVKLDKDGKNVD